MGHHLDDTSNAMAACSPSSTALSDAQTALSRAKPTETATDNENATHATSSGSRAQLSAFVKLSNALLQFAPNGKWLAVAKENRLAIRNTENLQIVQLFSTIDLIQSISWSQDSQFIATCMYKRAVVQIWSLRDVSWSCKISEGLAGMVFARWCPIVTTLDDKDAFFFLTVADFQLHATVWSLSDCSKYVLRYPKLGGDGFTFSDDNKLMAVAERTDCKDHVGVYSCETWELITHFPVESYDLVEIVWCPGEINNSTIAIRDNPLEYRILFYSIDGTPLAKYQAYENALGLKAMAWSPSGQFIALGSFDEHLRILNHLNWKPVVEFDHETIALTRNRTSNGALGFEERFADERISDSSHGKRLAMAQAPTSAQSAAVSAAFGRHGREICFVVRDPPFSVVIIQADPLKENPRMGISRVAWSPDSRFLATKSDSTPQNVWIWKTDTMRLHCTIALLDPIRAIRWEPTQSRLAICSAGNRVYFWTDNTVTWVDIPSENFKVLGLRWNPKGKTLAAIGRHEFCSVYL